MKCASSAATAVWTAAHLHWVDLYRNILHYSGVFTLTHCTTQLHYVGTTDLALVVGLMITVMNRVMDIVITDGDIRHSHSMDLLRYSKADSC